MTVLVIVLCMIVLVGCASDADNMENIVTEPESQVVSEEVSEPVSEDRTESLSVEVSEEVVDYSAESVMAKIDEIIATCPYDDSEQIKATVIGLNLEYISDEDLTILIDTYGYTLEELKDLFDAYMEQYLNHMWLTFCYNIGAGEVIDTMDLEKDLLENRANIYDMYIGQEEAKITVEYIVTSLCENDLDKTVAYILPNEYPNNEECPYNYESFELTSNQKSIINYILINNEVWILSEEDVIYKLSYILPYDGKLNAQ